MLVSDVVLGIVVVIFKGLQKSISSPSRRPFVKKIQGIGNKEAEVTDLTFDKRG